MLTVGCLVTPQPAERVLSTAGRTSSAPFPADSRLIEISGTPRLSVPADGLANRAASAETALAAPNGRVGPKGRGRIRTGVHGFAIRCLTTWLHDPSEGPRSLAVRPTVCNP